jgi:hypothetical protein
MFPKADVHPILFEEICIKETQEMIVINENQFLILRIIKILLLKRSRKPLSKEIISIIL